jgi:hypothetical protein
MVMNKVKNKKNIDEMTKVAKTHEATKNVHLRYSPIASRICHISFFQICALVLFISGLKGNIE